MKNILYIMYALIFYLYSILPLNENKTTFIMTHDSSENGNIMRIYKKIKVEEPNQVCEFISKNKFNEEIKIKKILNELKFIIITPYYLATSKTIFLDNVFLPMAYIKFKPKVRIVQLWHGCNTLKKFGQLSNTGLLKKIEKRANSRYTHVIVSSKKMIKLHEEAFGVSEKVIYPLGLPRMDVLFDMKKMQYEKKHFFYQYNNLINKKIILYAPTFRDNDLEITNDSMDLSVIIKHLPKDFVILTRFHPFVHQHSKKINDSRIMDMSNYEDLTRLLLISDILITDYSSIIFDYAVLNKPIIYYAYDKDDYENNIRGFYYNYEQYIDSEIVKTKEELVEKIININVGKKNTTKFIDKYIDYKDSEAVNRIYKLVYKESILK